MGASRPPQKPQQSQALNWSTYRLLLGSPRCSRRGSASVGRREGENGSNDPPPPQRGLPGRSACRVGPGGGHCLLEDKESLRKSHSHQPMGQSTGAGGQDKPTFVIQDPPLSRVAMALPKPLSSATAFIRWQQPRNVRLWTLPAGTRTLHHWALSRAFSQEALSFDPLP